LGKKYSKKRKNGIIFSLYEEIYYICPVIWVLHIVFSLCGISNSEAVHKSLEKVLTLSISWAIKNIGTTIYAKKAFAYYRSQRLG
jgi:hypothetical protein